MYPRANNSANGEQRLVKATLITSTVDVTHAGHVSLQSINNWKKEQLKIWQHLFKSRHIILILMVRTKPVFNMVSTLLFNTMC